MSDPISTKLIFSDGNYDDKQMRSAWECEESICTEDVLRFGTCEANGFKVSLINDGTSLVGKSFDLQVTIGDSLVPTSYGTYKVQDEKFSKKQHDIMAYDLMYEIINANVADWYNGLTFPITLQNMRDSFLALFGLSTASNLANNFSVSKTITPTDLSGRRVLSSICELNGCWPNISRTGAYEEIKTGTAHTITKYIDEENAYFQTDLINKLQLRATADDIGVIYGSGDNCYIVEDNFLLYGKTSEELTAIATTMYSLISSFRYTPATLTCDGDTSIKVGDKLNVTTKEGVTYSTIALYRLTKGKKRLKDTYTANGEKKQREQVNSTHSDILQLKGQTNELSRDINATKSTITTIEGDISNLQTAQSTLTQTSNELIASVSTLEKRIDQEVETYEVDYEPTLYNYPAMDWCTSFPVDGTIAIADDTVAWTYSDDDYKNHLGYVAYARLTNTMYRFSKLDDGTYGWKAVVNSDMSYVMEKVAEIDVKVDGITQTVSETYETKSDAQTQYGNLTSQISTSAGNILQTVSNTYETKSNINSNYYTKTETTSKINQTSTSITATVAKTDDAWDERDLSITISLRNYGTPSDYYDAGSYSGSYYLDNATGQIWASNGTAWSKYGKPLTRLLTASISEVSQDVESVRIKVEGEDGHGGLTLDLGNFKTEVSTTYETKSDASTKQSNLVSQINQSANNVSILVAETSTQWDTSAYPYTIDYYTLGDPYLYYNAQDNLGKYCLNEKNGFVYKAILHAGSVQWSSWGSQLTKKTDKLQSEITTNATSISAKVSKSGGSSSSFGWELYDDHFKMMANNVQVFKCDSSGIEVNGKITTTSGNVAGWVIEPKQIHNKVTKDGVIYQAFMRSINFFSDQSLNTHAFAVEVSYDNGTTWDPKFYVDYAGKLHAQNAEITGYTKTEELQAQKARIDTIESSYIKTNELLVNGKIKADYLDVTTIASSITTVGTTQAGIAMGTFTYPSSIGTATFVIVGWSGGYPVWGITADGRLAKINTPSDGGGGWA